MNKDESLQEYFNTFDMEETKNNYESYFGKKTSKYSIIFAKFNSLAKTVQIFNKKDPRGGLFMSPLTTIKILKDQEEEAEQLGVQKAAVKTYVLLRNSTIVRNHGLVNLNPTSGQLIPLVNRTTNLALLTLALDDRFDINLSTDFDDAPTEWLESLF